MAKKEENKKLQNLIEGAEQAIFNFEMQEKFLQEEYAKDPNDNLLRSIGDTQNKLKSQNKWLAWLQLYGK